MVRQRYLSYTDTLMLGILSNVSSCPIDPSLPFIGEPLNSLWTSIARIPPRWDHAIAQRLAEAASRIGSGCMEPAQSIKNDGARRNGVLNDGSPTVSNASRYPISATVKHPTQSGGVSQSKRLCLGFVVSRMARWRIYMACSDETP